MTKTKNSLSIDDRIKLLESIECQRKFMPLLPICVRLDGKCFHNFTKDLDRPYDLRMSQLMIDSTKFLVEECQAVIGYTQSDEISLILFSDSYDQQLFF